MEGDPACGLALADEEAECSSWDSDDEYQKFIQNMNPPRVTIDNTSCPSAIVIHYGILLEVVQVLTNLKLIVTKAYISSDGGWFMDGRRAIGFFPFRQNGKCPPTKEKPKHRSMVLCSWRPVQKLGSTSSPYSARSLDPF
ncbi:Ras-related protein RABH1b [Zea mays]|uniref:ACT domain-containing protein ACR n=1 Tax=Zea mays TaxID=4577 RepID=A0A1D6J0L8_MAIZE|nr:Ras-related protein RABH1b [Zea mays]